MAVIVLPGGSYQHLATNHEGRQIANWLNALGITSFVLKYRLGPRYHHPVELGDAQRAIRMVRARAKEFGVLPDQIGVMGFSAGGHLASTTETHFDAGNPQATDPIERASSRPDFAVLAYPVISFTAEYTHQVSRRNLLGENPAPELVKELSSELNVTPQTPPTFLFSSSTDTVVPPKIAWRFIWHYAAQVCLRNCTFLKMHRTASDSTWLILPWESGPLYLCTGFERENYFRVLCRTADGYSSRRAAIGCMAAAR